MDGERLADRLTRLARVTAELVMADTVEAITKIVISHAADAAGANMATLTLREGEDHLRLVGIKGGTEDDARKWQTYPLDVRTPASDVVRSGERLVIDDAAAFAERYPNLTHPDRGERSVVCLPLHVSTRVIGAVGLAFPGSPTIESAEIEFFEILADTCAQALDRVNALEQAGRQTAKLEFLSEASAELASSLDYETTLVNVAKLAVPAFADWCAIDLVEDGRLNRLAVEHVDPAKVQLARALEERYPADPEAPSGAWNVMRTGQSQLVREITDAMLVAGARDAEHLRVARDLQLRSALMVPLVARGRVLGVVSWVSTESDRLYEAGDLALAEDLAKRAAVAIDNAELYSQTSAAAVRLQHAVLPEKLPTLPRWELAKFYSPAGRTEVGGDFYDAVPLANGQLVLFVGDVMGRGVDAAAAMARTSAAVRAYMVEDATPRVVMTKLDRMFEEYRTDQLVTLVYLVLDPTHDGIVMANAGHPSPFIRRAVGRSEELPFGGEPPLGAPAGRRQQETAEFHVGDTLLAFTDGLVERRDEDVDESRGRLREHLRLLAGPDLSAALDELVGLVRDPSRDDDVAALAVRRTG
jgi:serine phosphatase RsbU (regulator of sigma subunit)